MTHPSRFAWSLLACVLVAVPSAFAQDPPPESARDFAKDILHDQKQIWTSPFRMTRQNAKWWLIFGGITGALIATDHRGSQQLPNTGDQLAFSRGVSRLGAEYTLIPIAYVPLTICFVLTNMRYTITVQPLMFVFVAIAVAAALKIARPETGLTAGTSGRSAG